MIEILKFNIPDEDVSINAIEIAKKFIKILDEEESHRYLGRQLCTSPSDRTNIELKNRSRWVKLILHKHNASNP